MKHCLRIIGIGGLLLGALNSMAANYSLQISDVTWMGSPGGYDCFTGAAYPNTVNFTITKTANGRKDYALTAGTSANTGSYTRQLSSGGSRLNYQLFTTSGMNYNLKAPPSAQANEVLSGSVPGPGGQVIPLSFVFFIPPGQVVPPGTYTDQVTISIYDAYDSVGSPQATRTITISAVVVAGAAMSIVPTGGPFNSSRPQYTLNFGTLSTGQQQSCDVLIKQNNNCTLYYSSANRGVLQQVPVPTTDQIPYSCMVAGAMLDLSQAGSLSLPPGISPGSDGARYPVNITIGNVGNASAGTYEDQITITVQAQ
jgi:spore coat protein U-like protein